MCIVFHVFFWWTFIDLKKCVGYFHFTAVDGKAPLATGEDDDDEVPDLVENFDEASKNEAN